MKIITLVPVKNEAWILPHSLKNYSTFSDHIIVADQSSTDGTQDICKQFEKVTLIQNPFTGHTNQIRWLLLDEARKLPGNNLIIYLDADELLSPACIQEMQEKVREEGTGIKAEWVQLFPTYSSYRIDGVWEHNYKEFAFLDDRILDYDRTTITNDHSNRIPTLDKVISVGTPILHLQYLAKSRCEVKQVFYMCTDFMKGKSARRVNHYYSVAKFGDTTKTAHTPNEWLLDIKLPSLEIFNETDTIKIAAVYDLFKEKGVLFFEGLDIWHVKEFYDFFKKETGRNPQVKKYPDAIIFLNTIKNRLKNAILASS